MNTLLLSHELLVLALALGLLLVGLWLPLPAKRKLGYVAALGLGLILAYSVCCVRVSPDPSLQHAFNGMYALDALEHRDLPQADRLVLLSPEIGVMAAAGLAVWQARLGYLLGLDKLAWNDILPEYDPFKYGSFAVNAGDLSHRITSEIQRRLDRLEPAGTL